MHSLVLEGQILRNKWVALKFKKIDGK
jgi:hypothetical protein